MTFDILTIFPHIFDSYLAESILKRAQARGLIEIAIHNLRDYTQDAHKTTDYVPYGGGPGMVMKIEPIYRALKKLVPNRISKMGLQNPEGGNKDVEIILLSARGKIYTQKEAQQYARKKRLILICGRYEGVDERVSKFVDRVLSIGPYVLTGGEVAAMAIVDSVSRLLPGVLGNTESLKEESYSLPGIEYPQYTRPEEYHGWKVPEVLLSGDHKKISEWKKNSQ